MTQPAPAPYGTPEAYREAIEEALSMARLQAELGATYAAHGDDAGLAYSVRKLVAYTRAALGTLGDLQKMKGDSHERAGG